MTETTALWHVSSQETELRPQKLPLSLTQWISRLKSAFLADQQWYPRLDELDLRSGTGQLHESMQDLYMEGGFHFPIKYGYPHW